VQEGLYALEGNGDPDLIEVSIMVAQEMCRLAGVQTDVPKILRSGAGRAKFEEMLAAQGGDLGRGLPRAAVEKPVPSPVDGWVESVDALAVGLACVELGAGRLRKEDRIDPAAGLVIQVPVGALVHTGEPLAVVHARSEELAAAVIERLQKAWRIVPHETFKLRHVLARVDKNGTAPAG
jgi:thymidine phosphorylase